MADLPADFFDFFRRVGGCSEEGTVVDSSLDALEGAGDSRGGGLRPNDIMGGGIPDNGVDIDGAAMGGGVVLDDDDDVGEY